MVAGDKMHSRSGDSSVKVTDSVNLGQTGLAWLWAFPPVGSRNLSDGQNLFLTLVTSKEQVPRDEGPVPSEGTFGKELGCRDRTVRAHPWQP